MDKLSGTSFSEQFSVHLFGSLSRSFCHIKCDLDLIWPKSDIRPGFDGVSFIHFRCSSLNHYYDVTQLDTKFSLSVFVLESIINNRDRETHCDYIDALARLYSRLSQWRNSSLLNNTPSRPRPRNYTCATQNYTCTTRAHMLAGCVI